MPGVMVCSAAAESGIQGPSAGTGFPLFETPLQAGTRAPSSLSDAAVEENSKIYSCVLVACTVNLFPNLPLMPHTHTEARAVGFEEHQHFLAHQVA